MGFANKYIAKQLFCDSFINSTVHDDLKIIVTIPVYMEPDVIACLESINRCDSIDGRVEVIILINSSVKDSNSVREFNRNTYQEIFDWILSRNNCFIDFYVHLVENLPKKHAGVGLARKIAMDEALQRFNAISFSHGIITGYDADTVCQSNYFTSIESFFRDNNKIGASIYYEHPVSGESFPQNVYESSAHYELYLRYYINALRYIGHPHAFHCIGSAYAVRAEIYSAQGGMNKKQAGEDFYFLQKIISLGGYGDITDTVLSPSSRLSDRTPFGTGRSIADMCSESTIDYKTYAFESFLPLIKLFTSIDGFYKKEVSYNGFSNILVEYLKSIAFDEAIDEINCNCSSLKVFRDKFFRYINIFKVLQYLNYSSRNLYYKESVKIGGRKLLEAIGVTCYSDNIFDLLKIFRTIDRNS